MSYEAEHTRKLIDDTAHAINAMSDVQIALLRQLGEAAGRLDDDEEYLAQMSRIGVAAEALSELRLCMPAQSSTLDDSKASAAILELVDVESDSMSASPPQGNVERLQSEVADTGVADDSRHDNTTWPAVLPDPADDATASEAGANNTGRVISADEPSSDSQSDDARPDSRVTSEADRPIDAFSVMKFESFTPAEASREFIVTSDKSIRVSGVDYAFQVYDRRGRRAGIALKVFNGLIKGLLIERRRMITPGELAALIGENSSDGLTAAYGTIVRGCRSTEVAFPFVRKGNRSKSQYSLNHEYHFIDGRNDDSALDANSNARVDSDLEEHFFTDWGLHRSQSEVDNVHLWHVNGTQLELSQGAGAILQYLTQNTTTFPFNTMCDELTATVPDLPDYGSVHRAVHELRNKLTDATGEDRIFDKALNVDGAKVRHLKLRTRES